MTRIIEQFAEISSNYDAAFVDLWGCMHDGVAAFPDAVAACQGFRQQGGRIVMVTNAPRPRASIIEQMRRLGVPDDAWDTIATSGDAARMAMFTGAVGNKVYHIGEAKDDPFFEPLKMLDDPAEITRVPLQEAEGIVCTGPFDPHADPAVNRPDFLYAKTKGLTLLCANPDVVVDMGDTRQWCAGALAQLYTEMGGESLYFGKPHPAIYDLARRRLAEFGTFPDDRIVCIGDGIATDIQGALGEGLDSIFITGGLAAEETRTERHPDPEALSDFLTAHQMSVSYAMGYFR
ncbi:TIGR01459 family HAD-type hydrolase [Tropicimonas isoalkanivorans]|uniref:HAD-superfamily class IIA hydrolase, TIGR01459 n=1 Tax=Tropicimonas isoalkanivorans TaxID=441112 RepID=A0A1I1PSE9_9RHOB|nr:TIGR01459 family HAD-type hydrolase [Tropicimonas isoalkanivorans]SFD12675.1 HAD-superfamily class IIA hydrolase, TIGR01459 [Tropicimonas isoalkanivorans]